MRLTTNRNRLIISNLFGNHNNIVRYIFIKVDVTKLNEEKSRGRPVSEKIREWRGRTTRCCLGERKELDS